MLILFMSANYLQHCVYEKYQVPSLFIFGDSLYDSENNNNLPTFAEFDYKPYGIDSSIGTTGRFTNGRTAIDIISNILSV
jgi:hypothetical protein